MTADLARENERLRDRIEELEAQLGARDDDVDRLRRVLGIAPQRAKILGVLLKRGTVSYESLMVAVWRNVEARNADVVKQHIVFVRRALAPHGIRIETEWGTGYRLAPDMRARLRELIEASS